ncbi:MAG: hypothetical protein FWG20_00995 [Candidatus Cloacimonetes bacterium]|nr:hypothetical protein [Candidatus Cloacimonadota bacterium]
MKKLMLIIILALLIITTIFDDLQGIKVTVEEWMKAFDDGTIYRKVTPEELVAESKQFLESLAGETQMTFDIPVKVTGIIDEICQDGTLRLAFDGRIQRMIVLISKTSTPTFKFIKSDENETFRHFGKRVLEGYESGDTIRFFANSYKFNKSKYGHEVFIDEAIVISD